MPRPALLSIWLCLSLFPVAGHAEWITDGVPLCQSDANQYIPYMTSDGAGGFVVVWQDFRNGNGDIYAQKLNAAGQVQWIANGVPVCSASGAQIANGLIGDGDGGIIVVWTDARSGSADLYAQRLDASGIPAWDVDGVAICTAGGAQAISVRGCIASDGAGGAIMVWTDPRTAPARIYAQRIDADGAVQWDANGVQVSPSPSGTQSEAVVLPDGESGALIVWQDSRPQSGQRDIYAQRLDASGAPRWFNGPENGVPVCFAAESQERPVIVSDGAGGFIAAWEDGRNFERDIYAQRMNGSGGRLWTSNGVAVASGPGLQNHVRMAADGAGGALLAWQDGRNAALNYDVYAQRLDTNGTPRWTSNGVSVCTNPLRQEEPKIVSDGNGGAFVAWFDQRRVADWDTYSQHLSDAGTPLWRADGVATSAAGGDQIVTTLVADGAGGAVCAFSDTRAGDYDVYAQFVTDEPNAVAIKLFEAVARDGVVLLRSAFRSDLGVEGITVYRGTQGGALVPIGTVGAGDLREFVYEDRNVAPGESYDYQIGVRDADGEFFSAIASVRVDELALQLEQNRPNPFNPSTTIRFVLPKPEQVTLSIYDASGVRVRTLLDGEREHGVHEVSWDGRDDHGVTASSGVYFYRLTAGKHSETKKMILLK